MIKGNIRFLTITVLFWFSQYVFNPFFSPYLENLEIASTIAGVILGAYALSQLILRVPFGIAADRLRNHKIFMVGGLGCLGAAGVLLYFAQSPVAFCAGRFLGGVSASTWVSFTVFFTNRFPKEEMGKAVAIVMLANNLGTLLSYVAGTIYIGSVGIRGLFLFSAAAAFLGAILMIGIPEKYQSKDEPMSVRDVITTIKNKNLLAVSLLAALAQLVLFASAINFIANYARDIGASEQELGIMSICLNGTAVIISFWMSSAMSQRISDRMKMSASFVFISIACFFVPHCSGIVGIYGVQISNGIGRAIVLPLTMSLALREIPPQYKSTAMGAYQCIYSLGMMFGPMLMGFALKQAGEYRRPYYLLGLLSVLGIFLSFIYSRTKKA